MAARPDTPAFAKGIARTVRGSLKRFVALTTITALGVTMLVGLRAACVDLRNSADRFFDEQNLFDVRVQCTLGLTDDDLAALAALDGVDWPEGGDVGSFSSLFGVMTPESGGCTLDGTALVPSEPSGELCLTLDYVSGSELIRIYIPAE